MSKPPQDLHALLTPAPRSQRRRWLALALAALAALALVAWLSARRQAAEAPRYLTESTQQGTLTVTVSANGNLQPTNQVDVGSELSGTIEMVGVDDNDRVTKGQVLARLDPRKLKDQVAKSRAALAAAAASVQQALASHTEAQAKLARLKEVERLSGGKLPSRAEIDSGEATLLRAQADVAAAQAAVSQAQATLSTDETNLGKTEIRAPITGVVLARKVEPGQTVAATMTTPVLFTLAEDLAQMELQVKVDEADVGQVREGQEARFSVDAYPGRHYPARITRVGLGSTTTDNVVTYLTVLEVRNEDLSLRPGMTATADILVARQENALLAPNAALRFTPPSQGLRSDRPSLVASLMPRPPAGQPKKVTASAGPHGGTHSLWVLEGGSPRQISVSTGLSNGRYTEILSGELTPGMMVITDLAGAGK